MRQNVKSILNALPDYVCSGIRRRAATLPENDRVKSMLQLSALFRFQIVFMALLAVAATGTAIFIYTRPFTWDSKNNYAAMFGSFAVLFIYLCWCYAVALRCAGVEAKRECNAGPIVP